MPRGHGSAALTLADWRALPEQMVAIEQQHERIVNFVQTVHEKGLLTLDSPADLVRGNSDVDFFLTALRRMTRVCALVRRSAFTETGTVREPLRLFEVRVQDAVPVRNFLEHFDEGMIKGRGGIGYGIGPGMITISYAGKTVHTHQLLAAAREVHHAVRGVVDPLAATDVHFRPACIPAGGWITASGPAATA